MVIERYLDTAGEWRWRWRADNGAILAVSSEGYRDPVDLDWAIDLIRNGAAEAKVVTLERAT